MPPPMDTLLPGLRAATNLHPILAEFPTVLWLTALVLLGLGAARRREAALVSGAWVAHAATAMAWVTSVSGLVAAARLGEAHPVRPLILAHRDWMLAAASLSLVVSAALVFFQGRRTPAGRWVPVLVLILTSAVGLLGADRGAVLVYRHGVGTTVGDSAPPR